MRGVLKACAFFMSNTFSGLLKTWARYYTTSYAQDKITEWNFIKSYEIVYIFVTTLSYETLSHILKWTAPNRESTRLALRKSRECTLNLNNVDAVIGI